MEIVRDKTIFRIFRNRAPCDFITWDRASSILLALPLSSICLSHSTLRPLSPLLSYTRLFHSLPLSVHEQRGYWVFAVTRLTKQYADIGNLPMAI